MQIYDYIKYSIYSSHEEDINATTEVVLMISLLKIFSQYHLFFPFHYSLALMWHSGPESIIHRPFFPQSVPETTSHNRKTGFCTRNSLLKSDSSPCSCVANVLQKSK